MAEEKLGYEAARAELIEVVRALEAGGTDPRGVPRAVGARRAARHHLPGVARRRPQAPRRRPRRGLDSSRPRASAARPSVSEPASVSRSACDAEPKTISVSRCQRATRAVSPPASVQVSQLSDEPAVERRPARRAVGCSSTYVVSSCGAGNGDWREPGVLVRRRSASTARAWAGSPGAKSTLVAYQPLGSLAG